MAVARAGEDASPPVPAPPALRPFLQFAKLPPRAVVAARRALDADSEFRARVAGDVSETEVGRAGWLFLTRPDGWEDDVAAMARQAAEAEEEAAERRAVSAARRRQAAADVLVRKADEAAAQAKADAAKATAALADERQSRRAAAREVTQLSRRLSDVVAELQQARRQLVDVTGEADAAKARVAELEAEIQARAAGSERETPAAPPVAAEPPVATPPPVAAPEAIGPVVAAQVAGALAAAAEAAAKLAESLASASAAVESGAPPGPAPMAPPAQLDGVSSPGAPPVRSDVARAVHRRRVSPRGRTAPLRRPSSLPPAVLEDSPEAAEHLLRLPGAILLVDGYNVSNAGWPGRPIAEQRRRLVDALTRLVARTGADVRVVFDGGELQEAPSVGTAARPVHVSFSPPGVEADDVILGQVAGLPPTRPLVVATSDRRVRDEAARRGANVVFSSQLLTVLR